MLVIVRAIVYSALFIGLVLIYTPSRLLSWSGIAQPLTIEIQQIVGIVIGVTGASVVLWCVFNFVHIGKGTPAPFDPPRRLVIRGPYRIVRNPMYMGAGLVLAGAVLFYESLPLLGYTGFFLLATHLLVVWYEEPALKQTFGRDYEAYCRQVGRWW
jgi:protein-S-isoprenylcysteine O-methyltransferase Ste14